MAVHPFCAWIDNFALALVVMAICGCTSRTSEVQPPAQVAEEAEARSRSDGFKREDTVLISGVEGKMVLAFGTVLTAEGRPCPNAVVTLDQDYERSARRCVFARSDAEGNYVIRGNVRKKFSNMIWAATDRGDLGTSWNSDGPVTIRLRGGSTVLHVRSRDGAPVDNATVTVFQSSIDTISEIVPPNIRKILRRVSDENGVVEFPSALGDGDLGFHVRTSGDVLMRAGYTSACDINLFVLDVDREFSMKCADEIRAKHFATSGNRLRIVVGYPSGIPPYLDSGNRVQP